MTPVSLTPCAREDLADICDSVALDKPGAADRLLQEIISRFQLISENPKIGRVRAELGVDIRCVNVGNYIIFYRLVHEAVSILRVLHGARDITSFLWQ